MNTDPTILYATHLRFIKKLEDEIEIHINEIMEHYLESDYKLEGKWFEMEKLKFHVEYLQECHKLKLKWIEIERELASKVTGDTETIRKMFNLLTTQDYGRKVLALISQHFNTQ